MKEDNETLIYNMYQAKGMLNRFYYKEVLLNKLANATSLDHIIKYIKYDQSLDYANEELLTTEQERK